jgi:hypothetical protein
MYNVQQPINLIYKILWFSLFRYLIEFLFFILWSRFTLAFYTKIAKFWKEFGCANFNDTGVNTIDHFTGRVLLLLYDDLICWIIDFPNHDSWNVIIRIFFRNLHCLLMPRSFRLWSPPAFHLTRRFNTEFTRALHLFLSWARPIQSTSPHPTSPRSILILSTHVWVFLVASFPLAFPPIIYNRSSSPHSCYTACPSHPSRLDYCNYTWRRVQITKLLVMQLSSITRHLIPLRSKYPPQHPVLKHPQSMFLP